MKYSRDIATEYNLPIREVSEMAKYIGVKKDAANIYNFTEEDIELFSKLVERRKHD